MPLWWLWAICGVVEWSGKFGKPSKARASDALNIILAFFEAMGYPIKHLHLDRAGEFLGTGVAATCKAKNIRVTTTVVGRSNMNRTEPQWRPMRKLTGTALVQANGVPYELVGEAWDDSEEVYNLSPRRSGPSRLMALMRGKKPKGAHRRCLGGLSVRGPAGGSEQMDRAPDGNCFPLCCGSPLGAPTEK